MTTNLRKSFPLALFLMGAIGLTLITSCKDDKGDGVWVPLPKDSSELGMKDHFMPKDSIAVYRKRFEQDRDTLKAAFPYMFFPLAEAFNKKSVIELMKNSKCVGLRIYYGSTAIEPNGQQDIRLILVGVDEKGNDLFATQVPSASAKAGDDPVEGGFEYGQCAPPCYKDPPPVK